MFRVFDMFGSSAALRALDEALRTSGIHPMLVPEPVKLTVIQLIKKLGTSQTQDVAFSDAAQLLAYCLLGHAESSQSNSAEHAERTDQRVDAALEDGRTLDAKLILLALHAGLMAPEIADRIDTDDLEPDGE